MTSTPTGTPGANDQRNLETLERWTRYYNEDVARMVTDCYSADCIVDIKGGITMRGHRTFVAVEQAVQVVAPRRTCEVERVVASGDTLVVQAVLHDPDRGESFSSPFCAILTMRDGLIVRDESYLDLRVWPSPKLTREEWSSFDLI